MLALLYATAVWGATYHLAPNGNDAAAGTEAAPWKTFAKVNALQPGDTLLVHEGTYTQTAGVAISVDGTEGAPITVQGVGAVTITGSAARIFVCGADLQPVNWLTFRNLRFYEVTWPVRFYEGANHVTFEDIEVARCFRGLQVFGGGDLTFRRVWIHDSGAGIGLGEKEVPEHGVNGALVEDCWAERNRQDLIAPPLPNGWVVSNDTHLLVVEDFCSEIVVRRCKASGHADAGFDLKSPCLVDSCFSTGSPNGYKLWGRGGPAVLRNSIAVNNLDTGVTFGAGVIENCTLANNGRCALRPNGPLAGIAVRNSILAGAGGGEVLVRLYRAKTSGVKGEVFQGDHNLYWSPQPTDLAWYCHDADRESHSLAGLAAGELPLGAGCLFADPLFANALAGDLHLRPGSPAIGAGVALAGVGSDYDGTPRPGQGPVTIGAFEVPTANAPPTQPDVTITPGRPLTDDTLVAAADGSIDPDGDPLTYRFAWYQDSALQSDLTTDTVPAERTARGQEWTCVVTPFDGRAEGPSGEGSVQIANAAPSRPTMTLKPSPPTSASNVVCSLRGAVDPDGDPLRYGYRWSLWEGSGWVQRRVLVTDQSTDTLTVSLIRKGQLWKCYARATDGEVMGAPATARFLIANAPPSRPTLTLTPAAPGPGDNVTARVTGCVDADGDPLRYTFGWAVAVGRQWVQKRGRIATRAYDALPSSLTASGQAWKCYVTATDGTDRSPLVEQRFTIGATASVASASVCVSSLSVVPTAAGAQIVFALSAPASVQAEVLNIAGRPVKLITPSTQFGTGTQTMIWTGQTDAGLPAPDGRYLIRLTARGEDGTGSQTLGTVWIER